MAKMSGKHLKVRATLDEIDRRLKAGERFPDNHEFEQGIMAIGYSYKEAEQLIIKYANGDVREAYIASFKGHLPMELKKFQR